MERGIQEGPGRRGEPRRGNLALRTTQTTQTREDVGMGDPSSRIPGSHKRSISTAAVLAVQVRQGSQWFSRLRTKHPPGSQPACACGALAGSPGSLSKGQPVVLRSRTLSRRPPVCAYETKEERTLGLRCRWPVIDNQPLLFWSPVI